MSLLTPDALAAFRDSDGTEPALLIAFLLGLVATSLHPVGLAVGGGLAGLLAPSLRRAVVLGVWFGVALLVGWALALVWYGSFVAVVTAVPLIYLAVGSGLALPPLAALAVRGLI